MHPPSLPHGLALVAAGLFPTVLAATSKVQTIAVDGTSFALNGEGVSYRFHVDNATGDLLGDHFGGLVPENGLIQPIDNIQGWVTLVGRQQREFPDLGRGDFLSELRYQSHEMVSGKLALKGLPATFGGDEDVSTVVVHMYDNYSAIAVDLMYSIFPKYDAIVRSVNLTNKGNATITLNKLSSFSVDLPYADYDLVHLNGDWYREAHKVRRHVEYGSQGNAGYSSAQHNPLMALVDPSATESQGQAWGFSLVYTGSHSFEVEKGSEGLTRALVGVNPLSFSWPVAPGETFTSPEVVAVYSDQGLGGMSRKFHRLYRKHLIKSKFATETRPALLNSWEGLYFDYNETTIARLARQTAELGVRMFVLDDGWFGDKYPRVSDNAGLGDWVPNPARFPSGFDKLISNITNLKTSNSSQNLKFGLWFEPEMVNPNSTLYVDHPDWALHAGNYPRTLTRKQLVLNLALPEVQNYIVDAVSKILNSGPISYVKWDNNRGIHEMPHPFTDHQYMLGVYQVYDRLTTAFPDVIWEGCASGGARFDPGILQYFPQIWTSDDTDAVERITIQTGTSLVYPPSAMAAHVAAVPNDLTKRTTPLRFRAHVAMMAGSFGFELDPAHLEEEDRKMIPGIVALQEKINPIVVQGDMWRLNLPDESNWPATLFISEDGEQAVLFYFQLKAHFNNLFPTVKLQGLDPQATYQVDGNMTLSGSTLMRFGLQYTFEGDYQSRVVMLAKE
ncbi:Glycoside hydrolase, family 36 [Cordyceps militaris CM01]|uniref:Alpha-galactosidase n=1 Tax=Cordyceps militaris (strain CM01) TaxID=983644 RepID=G3JT30_CORMM|nr:Glycoside hydrolase, family 36 [Cordyceps militaris CM01]EGX89026.1 Glycoside hydrolase, family 36 [Cordyceps militaris CM01]